MHSIATAFRKTRALLVLISILLTVFASTVHTPPAQAQFSSGSSNNMFSSGSSGSAIDQSRPLDENEYRDAQGNIYRVNPKAQLASESVTTVLFPNGTADVGLSRTVSSEFVAANRIEQGSVFSIVPSAAFPTGALTKVTSLQPTNAGFNLNTAFATLDDVLLETTGEVSFQGTPYLEGDTFISNDSNSPWLTIPYNLEFSGLLDPVETETSTLEPVVELNGDIKLGMDLGYSRPHSSKGGDTSLTTDTTVTGALNLSSPFSLEVSEDANEVLKSKLTNLKTDQFFVFMVGTFPIIVSTSIVPIAELSGEIGRVDNYQPTFSTNFTTGLKFIKETGRIQPIAKNNFFNFDYNQPVQTKSFMPNFFTFEAAAGVDVEAALYELIGLGVGAKIPLGVEIASDKCEMYANFEGPSGYGFLQPFVDSHRIEARFTPEFLMANKPLKCPWLSSIDYDTRAVPNIIKEQMLSMKMPKVCRHEAGYLENGALPTRYLNTPSGFLTVLTGDYSDDLLDRIQAIWIDANNDGEDEIALLVQCYAGGVAWPQSIFLLDSDLNLISAGPDDTGLQLPDEYRMARTKFSVFETKDNALVLEYPAYATGDAACCASLIAKGTMKIIDGKLIPTDTVSTRPRS